MFGVIIGIDIEKYSHTERTDEMIKKRKTISQILSDATKDIEIFNKKEVIDTGDGGFILIDSGKYDDVLKAMQIMKEKTGKYEGIRFRAILHVGKYSKSQKIFNNDENECETSFSGDGINTAARYLDSSCLKELLEINKDTKYVFGISNEFYKQVFDQEYFLESDYIKYGFKVKDYSNLIFLNVENISTIPEIERIQQNNEYMITSDYYKILYGSDFVYQLNQTTSDLYTFFVYPDLMTDKPESKTIYKVSSENVMLSFIKNPNNIVIAGEDQTGKTSICKVFYKTLYDSKEYIPIYIHFSNGEKGNILNKIDKALSEQYGRKRNADYENKIKTLILDDFHLLDNIDQRKHIEYLKNVKNIYAIIIVDSLFNGSIEKQRMIDYFKTYTIKEFGYLLRKKIIEKWIDFNCISEDNYCTEDELCEYLETTFVRGIIPFTPFYILTVLAARTDFVPLNGDLTSKGHCYQALIYISLRKINVPENEIGAFLNILCNIAFLFYRGKISSFTEDELNSFLNEYSDNYNLPFENKYFIKIISRSSIFHKNSIGQYAFYAPYFYHYFVAKYLADRISDQMTHKYIENIYNNLHIKMNAYIGIFLVHHSKDIRLIEEVLINTMVLYDEYKEINLTKEEMKHIDDYASKLNREVIEEYDKSQEKRVKLLNHKDYKNITDKEDNEDNDIKASEEIKNELINIKKAIGTIEVMGHILKNHSGEIEKKHLKDCYVNSLNAYRRMCNRFITEFKNSENEFIDFVVERIQEIEENTFTREDVANIAHRIFTFFNMSVIYATIKRTANSVGSRTMMKIIKEVSDDIDNPFAYCVYLQCEMWYNKSLPIEEAKRKYKDLPISVQYIVQRLLKEFTDLHHINYRVKQQIATSFNMKLSSLEYDHEK